MLTSSLSATATDGGVEATLTVRNDGDQPVELAFTDGQRADFAAFEVDGGRDEEAWRWSAGRMFTQALGTERVPPGGERTYSATWDDPPSGSYRLVGELVAENADVRATATVEV